MTDAIIRAKMIASWKYCTIVLICGEIPLKAYEYTAVSKVQVKIPISFAICSRRGSIPINGRLLIKHKSISCEAPRRSAS